MTFTASTWIGFLAEFQVRGGKQFGGQLRDGRRHILLAQELRRDAYVLVDERELERARKRARPITRCGKRFIDVLERPLEALITSSATCGLTPALESASIPSPRLHTCTASSAWLTAFTACPAPTGPQCTIFSPNACSAGIALASVAGAPPTITVSFSRFRTGDAAAHRSVEKADSLFGEPGRDLP